MLMSYMLSAQSWATKNVCDAILFIIARSTYTVEVCRFFVASCGDGSNY